MCVQQWWNGYYGAWADVCTAVVEWLLWCVSRCVYSNVGMVIMVREQMCVQQWWNGYYGAWADVCTAMVEWLLWCVSRCVYSSGGMVISRGRSMRLETESVRLSLRTNMYVTWCHTGMNLGLPVETLIRKCLSTIQPLKGKLTEEQRGRRCG